jgi:hypothetical protein
MSDNRFIINEVRRNLPGVPIESLQTLINASSTLKSLVDSGFTGYLTPVQIRQIVTEVQNAQRKFVDRQTLIQTLENIKNNSFFVTPVEAQLASETENYEDIPLSNTTLLSTLDGDLFYDPEAEAFVLAPTPNVRIEAPETSPEGYVGPLDPTDVDNLLLLLEDEIRQEYEAQGEPHALDTITESGRVGVFGLTVDDLVEIGVVSQNAIDDWAAIPEDEHDDYGEEAVKQGLISRDRYDTLSEIVRTSLMLYVVTNQNYWIQKAIGPKAFLTLREIQRALAFKAQIKDWKGLYQFLTGQLNLFAMTLIDRKSVVAANLILQRLFGKNAVKLYGYVGLLANPIGRKAKDVYNTVYRGIQTRLVTKDIAQLKAALNKLPTPPVPSVRPSRKFKLFPNIKQQKTNEAFVRVPETQGFYDPNRVYPRVHAMGEADTNRLARAEKIKDTIVGTKDENRTLDIPVARGASPKKWSQPKSPYNAKYPHNHVYESESGHVMEYDDTPDNERVHLYHREGSFLEIDRNGTWTRKVVGDAYEIYERNGYIYIAGKANITIDGNCNVYVKNNVNLQVDGNLVADVHKNMTWNIAKDLKITAGGAIHVKSKKQTNIESTDNSINIKAKNAVNANGSNVNVRAEKTLKLSGELKASLASPKGAAMVLAGLSPVVINGPVLSMLPQPGFAAQILASQNAAGKADASESGAPPRQKNPVEPVFPPLVLESRIDDCSEALSTLSENPDENQNEINVLKKKAIDEGLLTKEEFDRPLTMGAQDTSIPPSPTPPKVASCAAIYGQTRFSPTYSLSKNVTLGLLKGTERLAPQHGLSQQDLVCNLKQLAENVLEPVFSSFGKDQVIVTSCFRWPGYNTGSFKPATGISFHEQGLAVDLCFVNKPFSMYYDFAKQIKQTMNYDKLLLEYRLGTVNGVTTYKPWIHVQWQQPAINLANGRKGGPPRKEVYTMKNDVRVGPANALINLLPNVNLSY